MLINGAMAQLTFQHAVELASRNSASTELASMDERRAYLKYIEARSGYLPQVTTGSFIAQTSGLPLYAGGFLPSIVNFSFQQPIFNPSQISSVKAAAAGWKRASLSEKFQRSQAMLECAIAYTELVKTNLQKEVLLRQERTARKMLDIQSWRTALEVEEVAMLGRAKLANAHTKMRLAELDISRQQLVRRLAVLTGLTEGEIEPSADSIPALPLLPFDKLEKVNGQDGDLRVKIVAEQARWAKMQAQAEHRSLWPTVEFNGQYALLPSFNNYAHYYNEFKSNNSTLGISIRLRIFDFAQMARAHQADIDAAKVDHEVSAIESEISDARETLRGTVQEMQFARDAAQLEYMLARIDSTKAEIGSEVGKTPLGSLEGAHVTEDEKLDALLESNARLQVAQFQLLDADHNLEPSLFPGKFQSDGSGFRPGGKSESPAALLPSDKDATEVKSILITPYLTTIAVGQSRQLSAFVVSEDGHVQQLEANWQSDGNWNCILSTSGMVTALAPGQVTITASTSGVSQSQRITITPGSPDR